MCTKLGDFYVNLANNGKWGKLVHKSNNAKWQLKRNGLLLKAPQAIFSSERAQISQPAETHFRLLQSITSTGLIITLAQMQDALANNADAIMLF